MSLAARLTTPPLLVPTHRPPRTGAEAARYGVLRRLAPALRHDMVVHLQAVAMSAEVLSARLERGSAPAADFQASVSKINRLAREAVMNCLKVVAWIEPEEDEGIQLHDGVAECTALLAGNFNFRGFNLVNNVGPGDFEVSRVALRHLLIASLLTLTDTADAPADVVLDLEVSSGLATLRVSCVPGEGDADAATEPGYRRLEWADVQALAVAESVELARSDDEITLKIPRLVATRPLQMAFSR